MSKIKAVLFDFDGSFVDEKQQYSIRSKELVSEIIKRGVNFSFATGRLYWGKVEEVINDLNVDGVHIFHGGAMIYDTQKKSKLWHQSISKTAFSSIIRYLQDEKIIFCVESEHSIYMSQPNLNSVYLNNVDTKDFSDYGEEEVLKLVGFAALNNMNEKVVDKHIKTMLRITNDISIIKFNFNGKCGFDVTSERSTKHTAVLEYCKLNGFNPKDVAAVGDSYNDYPLLTAVGHKIAMGNSHDELKKIADKVVSPIDTGGTEEAMRFILDKLI